MTGRTWTMKVSGAVSQQAVAEYDCAACDFRFEQTVQRDENSDPPASIPCPDCGEATEHVISAPSVRDKTRKLWAPHQGKQDAPPPWVADTRPLADGMSMSEWEGIEKKKRLDRTRTRMRKKGLLRRKKTIVGAGGKSSLPT